MKTQTPLHWHKGNDNVFRSQYNELYFFIIRKNDKYVLYVNNWGVIVKSNKISKCKKMAKLIVTVFRKEFKAKIRYTKGTSIWKEDADQLPMIVGILPSDPKYEIENDHEIGLRYQLNLPHDKFPSVIEIILLGPFVYGYTKASLEKICNQKEDETKTDKRPPYLGRKLYQTPKRNCRCVMTITGITILRLKNAKYKTIRNWVKRVRRKAVIKNIWPTIGALRHTIHNMNPLKNKEVCLARLNEVLEQEVLIEDLIFKSLTKIPEKTTESIVSRKKKKSKKKTKRQ